MKKAGFKVVCIYYGYDNKNFKAVAKLKPYSKINGSFNVEELWLVFSLFSHF